MSDGRDDEYDVVLALAKDVMGISSKNDGVYRSIDRDRILGLNDKVV